MSAPESKETQAAQILEQTLRTWKQSGEQLLLSGEFKLDPLFYRHWKYFPMRAESKYHDRATAAHALIFLTEEFDDEKLFASHVIMTKETGEDFYKLTGGYIWGGEAPDDAVKREAEEETGLTNLKFTRIGTLYFPKNESRDEEIVALYVSLVDDTTSLTQTDNSNIEVITAILYTFFHINFSQKNVHDSFKIEQDMRKHLEEHPQKLRLLPRFQAT